MIVQPTRRPIDVLCNSSLRLFRRFSLSGASDAWKVISALESLCSKSRAASANERLLTRKLVHLLENEGRRVLAELPPGTDAVPRRKLAEILERARKLTTIGGATRIGRERRGIHPFTKQPITIPAKPIKPPGRELRDGLRSFFPAKKAVAKKSLGQRTAKKAARKSSGAKKSLGQRPAKKSALPIRKARKRASTRRVVSSAEKPQWSPVLLGVSAPRATKRGEAFTARFAAYVKKLEREVSRKLTAMADVEASVGYSPLESTQWRLGTRVTVRVSGDHFGVEPREAHFTWNGAENVLGFQVRTSAGAKHGKTQLRFEAFIGKIRVAFIPVDLTIGSESGAGRNSTRALPHRKAFASYARRDARRVNGQLKIFNAAVRDAQIFTDCFDIKRGEIWKDVLKREISAADTFLLFWSNAAAESKWVGWEWRRAYKERKSIQPFQLDRPSPPLPPQLAKFQASDRFDLVGATYRE